MIPCLTFREKLRWCFTWVRLEINLLVPGGRWRGRRMEMKWMENAENKGDWVLCSQTRGSGGEWWSMETVSKCVLSQLSSLAICKNAINMFLTQVNWFYHLAKFKSEKKMKIRGKCTWLVSKWHDHYTLRSPFFRLL